MNGRAFITRVLTVAMMVATVIVLSGLFSIDRAVAPIISEASKTAEAPEAEPEAQTTSASYDGINYAPSYNALDPLTPLSAAADAALFDPQDDYWGLPRTPGHEEVALYCTACHSLRIVMQQKQTRDGWNYLLTWMSEEQGMAPLDSSDRDLVLEYLAREFGE